jgi:2-keto-4-pentenoate hydratase/2-oxohepta-3-ene-1,7-dioic acid hydratase in catechol pathway
MRLASYNIRGRTSFGAVVGDGIVDLQPRLSQFGSLLEILRAGALDQAKAAAAGVRPDFPVAEAELLPPVIGPEKILCIGINYAKRHAEYNIADQPKYPSMFLRVPGSLAGHDQPIVCPKVSNQFDYEGEIVLVIGKGGRYIGKGRALDHIAGLTLCNEGSVRDWMRHGQFNVTQGKNFDRSGSVGPWIVTSDDIDWTQPLRLTTKVNDETRQDDTTANLIFDFGELLAYITTFMTLMPGDLIATGTPTGAGARFDPPRWLVPGDVVEVACPAIGTLRNKVIAEA